MVDSKFFNIPFGATGDKATIPEATQPSGAVSYQQGFGPDYERDPATDPLAKRVPRDESNEIYYQLSNSVKFLQLYGLPEWYAEDDSGNPVSYPLAARVRHPVSGTMQAWVSVAAANTATPGTDPTKWVLDTAFDITTLEATLAEALAGTLGTKIITPRRMAAAVQRSTWLYGVAGGTGNAATLTLSPAPAALADLTGQTIHAVFPNTNTGAMTLNVNGLGAVPVVLVTNEAVPAGLVQTGGNLLEIRYNGTAFVVLTARPATQDEVNAGVSNGSFVTPLTLAKERPSYMSARAGGSSQVIPTDVFTTLQNFGSLNTNFRGASTFSAGVLTIGAGDDGLWGISLSARQAGLDTTGFAMQATLNNVPIASDGGQTANNGATGHAGAAMFLPLPVGSVLRWQIIQTTGGNRTFTSYDISAARLGNS